MGFDVLRELRVHLVQHVLPVVERPHLAHGLVADAGDDTADLVQHVVGGAALGPPVVLAVGQANQARCAAVLGHGHQFLVPGLVLHVEDAGAYVDQRLELRMGGHVGDALAVDPDAPAVADRAPGIPDLS